MTSAGRLIRGLRIVIAALGLLALPSGAEAQRRCTGADLLAELATTDAAAHARIVAEAKGVVNGQALFWKIEKAGLPTSYLLGTVHLTDERVHRLPAPVKAGFAAATAVALEVEDPSPEKMAAAIGGAAGLFVFTDGRSLQTMISPEEFAAVRGSLVRAGMPGEFAQQLRPWFVYLHLSISDCERGRAAAGLHALDQRLALDAKAQGKAIVGLETVMEQLNALASMPEADQIAMLRAGIALNPRIDDVMETLVLMYLERRIGAAWPFQILLAEKAGIPARSFDSFNAKLVSDRNRRMAERSAPLLAKGGAFIAVGALHLPGGDGLVALIEAQGYRLTPGE